MKKSNDPKAFSVVAIGASAGGLKAFEDLLSALPSDSGMAFVLVPHLAPQHKSHLTEILARHTKLRVSEIKNGDKVSPNRIYILPPNRAMQIKEGVLHVSASGHKSDWRNPIDSFFCSLAKDQGNRAIGVLLSGEGSDGTQGLLAIKESGGMTFAQNEATASHLSMPHSAVASGCVDFILPPAEIGRRLGSRKDGGNRYQDREKNKTLAHDEGSLNRILELLRSAKGVEFELYKRGTLRRRIQRRMLLKRIHDPKMYFQALKGDSQELELLYRDILISVTSFFREPESFRALKSTIYPRILKNMASHAHIRIWIPGCSTGEEAYSHAINLVEFLDKQASQIPFQIFATDVNPVVIEKARAGLYAKKIKAELSPERLRRFFVETDNGYRIVPSIRERCVFAAQNLVKDPPFSNIDLISCRNLLIYLGPTLQEKVLQIFQYALKPRGILMLGRSETIGDFSGRFTPLNVEKKVFSERTAALSARLDFIPSPGRFLETEASLKDPERGGPRLSKPVLDAFDLQGGLDSILPQRYIPNGVIVNSELEILRFFGNTSSYLRPAPGKPSMNLRRMASAELLLELRTAIHVSNKSACVVRKEIVAPDSIGVPRRIRIEVLPINASRLDQRYFLVLFEEVVAEDPGKRRFGGTQREKENRRVIELREELTVSGEHLKAIIEEQESTNARLKASNEELLSSNEELQSINEEFETAKEELQSTNEELILSSDEVRHSNQILNRTNSDLSNLLANINIPIVLLGSDLRVRHFTQSAEKMFDLSVDSIGNFLDAKSPLRLPNLKQLLLSVLKTGSVKELEAQDAYGRWHYLFLRPYRADNDKTSGVVLALIDINERKLAEKTVQRLATLVRDSNDAVIIRDLKDHIISWNKGAQKMYGYTEEEALGMNIRKLIPGDRRMPTREVVRVLVQGKKAVPMETQRRNKDGRTLDVMLTVTVLRDENGHPVEIATTERDITDQKQADREFRRLHARVICAQETERKRLARELHDGVGQILSGVKFRLESLPGKISLSEKAATDIRKVGEGLDLAISEIRRVSENLMPSELEALGLEAALLTLCREFKERVGIQVTLRTGHVPASVEPELAVALFRIAQEALNNIGKHSKATIVAVALFRKGKELILSVNDNGIGFNLRSNRSRTGRGIGLGNMCERAESVGGSIELNSTLGVGTMLSAHIPLAGLGESIS